MAKTLIAFFSRADENYFGGAMRYVKVGNTEIVANIIKDLVPADSFKIEMKNPYSPVYMTCIEEAKKDLRAKARPELVSLPGSIDEYDTVILAYPNYWGTMPMAVYTFLESFDFSGKTILPLCTNEGSGMGVHQRRKRHGLERARDQEDLPRRGGQKRPAHHRQRSRKFQEQRGALAEGKWTDLRSTIRKNVKGPLGWFVDTCRIIITCQQTTPEVTSHPMKGERHGIHHTEQSS